MGNTLAWDLVVHDRSEKGVQEFAGGLDKAKDKAKAAGKAIGVAFGAAGGVAAGLLAKGFSDNLEIGAGRAKLAGQLGLSEADSKKAGEAAGAVYADNWGSSVDEVNEAIRSVSTNLGSVTDLSKDQLKKTTEQALAFSSTMGKDLPLATEAAAAMIKNGLAKNATEAFDILTAGSQNGVDKADDLLETFQEYSPQFKKLGINGKGALNLLSAGLQAGARDTDVIADAFKELSIRVIDGSATTKDAYKSLGLNNKKMAEDFGKGGESARKATDKIIQGLLKIKDPVERNRVGVELFGTQWEDTVQQILPALGNTKDQIKNVDGATKRMSDTVGDTAQGKIETIKRKFEQWTQSMAGSDGAMGTVVTGLGAFGGGAVAAAGQAATVAAAFKGTAISEGLASAATWTLNGALKALKAAWLLALGPVGLIVAGIALVAAGLIYAYKHCEAFRKGVNATFKWVASQLLHLVDIWLHSWQIMFDVLGKLPGKAGAPFRSASKSVQGMRDKVNALRHDIDRVHGKKVGISVTTSFYQRGKEPGTYGKGLGVLAGARAAGGPVNAGQTYLVGENGPEIFTASASGRIIPNSPAATRAARSAAAFRKVNSLSARARAAALAGKALKTGDGGRDEAGYSSDSGYGGGSSGGGDTILNLIFNGKPLVTEREIRQIVDEAYRHAPAGTRAPGVSGARSKAAEMATRAKGRR